MWLPYFHSMSNTCLVHPHSWDRLSRVGQTSVAYLARLHALQHAKPCLPQLSTGKVMHWGGHHDIVGCYAVQGSGKAREVRTALSKRIKDAMTDAFCWRQDDNMVAMWGPSFITGRRWMAPRSCT